MAKLKAPFALDRSLNTTEQTSRNIADVLAEELSAIITALGGLNFINYEVVEELPTTEISTTTIYLVPSDDPQSGNTYDEYINLNGTVSGWEKIGSTAIDLSGYYTSAETDALLDEKVDKDSFDEQTATDEFETINGGLLSECKVALSPNQDLHGYPEPWVGGAGKNKLPLVLADIKAINTAGTWSGNVYTISGTTFEVITDDADNVTGIKINGITSGGINFNLADGVSVPLNDSYKFFGCDSFSSGVGAITYSFSGASDVNVYKNAVTSTISGTFTHAHIYLWSGKTFNNVMVYPMFMLASESDDSFAPYSNICPITGHTEVKVGDDGKNLFNPSNVLNAFFFSGYNITSEQSTRMIYAPCKPNTTYTVSKTAGQRFCVGYTKELPNIGVVVYDKTSDYTASSITITTGEDAKYIVAYVYHANYDTITADEMLASCQIELGSTSTPYVPYNGYQITVNLGGTYYSGTLDVVSGVFTVTHTFDEFDGSSDENWTINGIGSGQNPFANIVVSDNNTTTSIVCNEFTATTIYTSNQNVGVYKSTTNLRVRPDFALTDATAWKTWLSSNHLQVCYPIATPFEIQLTPQQIETLVGKNHLSAPLEGQEITESKYKKMFTFDDVIAYIQSL